MSARHYVGEIVEKLGFEQNRVSHNLGCLQTCGFVQCKWQGKNKVYHLHPDLLSILNTSDKQVTKYAPALESCGVFGKRILAPTLVGHPQ